MRSNEFGSGRVPMQQSRIDAGSFRQASVMTGANPVSPSRESFRPTDRQVEPRLDSKPRKQQSAFLQQHRAPEHIVSVWTRRERLQPWRKPNRQRKPRPLARTGPARLHSALLAAGSVDPVVEARLAHIHSAFRPAEVNRMAAGRLKGRGATQSRSNYSQPSAPPRQYENNSRGGSNDSGSSRPTLNMQQPVVTPRGGGSYSGRPMPSAPSGGGYGGYRGGQPGGGGSNSPRPMPSAPSGGGYGGYRGGQPSGGGSNSPRPMPSAPSGGGSHGGLLRAADRAEATPEADHMATLPVADTITTK